MAQWVKGLTAPVQVTVEAWVQSPAQGNGVRIWRCRSGGVGHSCSSDIIPRRERPSALRAAIEINKLN